MSPRTTFEQCALPHLEAAHNLAYWLVRSRPDAEDIVQDAFVRAFRAFGTFRGGDIKPWLLTIVRNVAYRWLSVRKRASNVISIEEAFAPRADDVAGEAWIASEEPSPEALLIGAQERGAGAARNRGTVLRRDRRHHRHPGGNRHVAPVARARRAAQPARRFD
jgi:RNA polymerase sigma-70 factor (ECF subfamily)